MKQAGVTDIYIDGPLGFQMDRISAAKDDIKIRVSPAISPNIALATSPNTNSFFIRPEDLVKYPAIDVIDFQASSQEREEALFDIYKRGNFMYDLGTLIPNLNISVMNPFIHQEFAERRLNCAQKCKIPGYSCHICDTQFRVTN